MESSMSWMVDGRKANPLAKSHGMLSPTVFVSLEVNLTAQWRGSPATGTRQTTDSS